MRFFLLITAILITMQCVQLQAQTAICTSFESSEGFVPGSIHNVSGWKLTSGTDALVDVRFAASEVFFAVNVQQPAAGTISLNLVKEQYIMNEEVTASVSLPAGFEFMGWTGDLAGVDNPRTFRVQKNMTIGATVADTNSPGVVRTVANVTQFKDALSKMNPGDLINNLIVAVKNPAVKAYSTASLTGVEFVGNLIHATGTASVGLTNFNSSQIMSANTMLVKSKCRAFGEDCCYESTFELCKLTKSSPAVDASVPFDFQQVDFEGQPVVGTRDIGADEFNPDAPIVHVPMNEQNAGPMAPESYITEISTSLILPEEVKAGISISPNPLKKTGTLQLYTGTPDASQCKIQFYDLSGILVETVEGVILNGRFGFNLNVKSWLTAQITTSDNIFYTKIISE